ncbi:MAG: DNA (cytosine-5-)-methyltransferase [Candidatus Niyogibacteria bacterium]|nr:DNA (cytosine-5-)-methyltransferase [Candidatus Niyogibacteria bacterium]
MQKRQPKNTTKQRFTQDRPLRVVELFAGVGGFRLGLENCKTKKKFKYKVVWSNQWEPATKKQHASEVYINRFESENHSNEDIAQVKTSNIPDHDLLVGGFPCQDYSVARVLSHAAGIVGKKGVLWWQIHRILKEKGSRAPSCLMLENVDRLLKSPVSQRGRDFAIMLASLNDLGYVVEWRVINAADYGMPQRRRRIFILGYKKNTSIYQKIAGLKNPSDWIKNHGTAAKAFPIKESLDSKSFKIDGGFAEISENFNKNGGQTTPFKNAGIVINRNVTTLETKPNYRGKHLVLGDITLDENDVSKEFFIEKKDLPQWQYLKGAKKEERSGQNGFKFFYNEGSMVFPDPLDKPSRTIITGEGGPTPSRFKHVIKTASGKLRRLTPLELERLCMFPEDHTAGQPDIKRAFFMGNALVVGVIEKLGEALAQKINEA